MKIIIANLLMLLFYSLVNAKDSIPDAVTIYTTGDDEQMTDEELQEFMDADDEEIPDYKDEQ